MTFVKQNAKILLGNFRIFVSRNRLIQNLAKKAKRNLDFFVNFLHISFSHKVFDFYCKIHFREKSEIKKKIFPKFRISFERVFVRWKP